MPYESSENPSNQRYGRIGSHIDPIGPPEGPPS